MKVIALCGYARSGKDTMFAALEKEFPNRKFVRVAFADALKNDMSEFLENNFGINVWKPSEEQKKLVRPLMVAYGKAKRDLDPDYWLKRGVAQIDENDDTTYVFTDVRYQNELDALHKFDCKSFFLERQNNGPANEEESNTITPLKDLADFRLYFPDYEDCGKCPIPHFRETLKEFAPLLRLH